MIIYRMKKKIKDFFIKLLTATYRLSYLIFSIISVFVVSYYYGVGAHSPKLSYFIGFLNVFISFITVMFLSPLLDLKLPKISDDRSKTTFFRNLSFAFAIYVAFGQLLWMNIAEALRGADPITSPETLTRMLPVVGVSMIFLYRSLLYVESSLKISKKKFNELFRDKSPVFKIFTEIHESKRFLKDIILASVFLVALNSFLGFKPIFESSRHILPASIKITVFIGLVFIVIELWIWLVTCQFRKEISQFIKSRHYSTD